MIKSTKIGEYKMKKIIISACLTTIIAMSAATAMADSIRGKVGISGKIGFMNPADNESDFFKNKTDSGTIAAVGLLYGLDDHIALEVEASRTEFGSETGDFGVTNISLGGQYRFGISPRQLVPFIGVGLDVLASNYDPNNGVSSDVDSTVGVHISGGIDFFLQKNLALSAEAKLVAAPEVKIKEWDGYHSGNFDPSSFSTTVGIRYFFN